MPVDHLGVIPALYAIVALFVLGVIVASWRNHSSKPRDRLVAAQRGLEHSLLERNQKEAQ